MDVRRRGERARSPRCLPNAASRCVPAPRRSPFATAGSSWPTAPGHADRVIALPRLVGPAIAGLPHGAHGFIPVDAPRPRPGCPRRLRGRRRDELPAQAGRPRDPAGRRRGRGDRRRARRAVEPAPFRPVLRGLLLTGGAPLYLRSALTLRASRESSTARRGPTARLRPSRAARCGGRRARSPAATSRRCSPRPGRRCCRPRSCRTSGRRRGRRPRRRARAGLAAGRRRRRAWATTRRRCTRSTPRRR